MQIPPTSADLRILQNLRFFAVNITHKDRQRRRVYVLSGTIKWDENMPLVYRIHVTHKTR